MSYQGQTWVDAVALPKLKNGGELLVMLRVANHAGNGPTKMSGCTASAETLARECLMGRSTVLKHLRELRSRGLLVAGDPSLVAHLPADKRPPVYDLAGAHAEGCTGGHTMLAECSQRAGVQIEHPQKTPPKKRRSAGAQIEHPQGSEPGAGVQIDPQRVFKSSTNSSKELKEFSLYAAAASVTADPTASGGSVTRERETDQGQEHPVQHAPAGPAAAEVREHPFPEQKAGGDAVARVVAAWTEARAKNGHGVPVTGEKGLARDVPRLLADGVDVEDLVAAAADMGRRAGWLSLPQHLQHFVPAARKPEPRQIEGRCPRHADFPEDACVICETAERRRRQRASSEPETIGGGGAALLARLRAGQPA
jgi:hypothetical protein